MSKENTQEQLLEAALNLIQTNGYNAFSYRDLAEQVGVKTSSIHYHFPTKADLGVAVVKYHLDGLSVQLDAIINDPSRTSLEKIALFFDGIFNATYLSDRKMCLGGMLASDVLTLPEVIQQEVRGFFDHIEACLVDLLSAGVKAKEFRAMVDVKQEVAVMLATLEGALLLARLYHDEKRLMVIKEQILARLIK